MAQVIEDLIDSLKFPEIDKNLYTPLPVGISLPLDKGREEWEAG
ncbi:hypothetical protein [Nostoc sp.]